MMQKKLSWIYHVYAGKRANKKNQILHFHLRRLPKPNEHFILVFLLL